MTNQRDKLLFIREGSVLYRLDPGTIQWMEVEGNHLHISTQQRVFTLRGSLRKIAERLPAGEFIQVHRSVMVRFEAIEKVDFGAGHIFVGEKALPLGPSYKDNLLHTLDLLN